MEWSRSDTLVLAIHNCSGCHGSGLRLARKGALSPCNCVLRSIFRICYDRFVRCITQERHLSKISMEPAFGRQRTGTWGRKDEEYIADFTLLARRNLNETEHRLFRYHFLLGADSKLCARRLGMERGECFHAIYRIQEKLGRVMRELEPYPLFPLDEYFNGPSRFGQSECKPKGPAPKQARKPEHLQFPRVWERRAA